MACGMYARARCLAIVTEQEHLSPVHLSINMRSKHVCRRKAQNFKMTQCAGPDGILHERGPGVFLQGLATYDPNGSLLPGPSLPADVVRSCFAFAEDHGVACVAFLGDTCVSTQMREYVRELHTRYYEPLADIVDLEAILQGPPVRKILFMTDARVVQQELKPHFDAALVGSGAEWTQAVDTMLEVVPAGASTPMLYPRNHALSAQS